MTINDLFEKIKEGAQTAGEFATRTATQASKKAGEVYNTSKHQITIYDLRNNISDLYKEIGALVYAAHKEGAETAGEIEEKLAIIDEKYERIDELKALIDEIKDTKACPNCGEKSEKEAEYCKKCGSKI